MNRVLMAFRAVGIHMCIGSVYAWSVFTKPVVQAFGITLKEAQFTFSLAIMFLGLSAAFMGKFVERVGPKMAGLLSALFFSVGIAGAGLAIHFKSVMLLYLLYGVVGGIGLGIGYITPVSTLVKWFPERRGLAAGLAVTGFGLSSLIFGPAIQSLYSRIGLETTFYTLGVIYLVTIFISTYGLRKPLELKSDTAVQGSGMTAKEAVKTWYFYSLWIQLFINIGCGIALISLVAPMAMDMAKMTAIDAAKIVGIVGLTNGVGRFMWAFTSDYIGRANTYTLFFAIQALCFYLLTVVSDQIYFATLLCIIATCYGGGFAVIPAYLSDVYGTKELGAIHGYILTAWAAAGMLSPLFAAYVRETTSSYDVMLIICSVIFIVGMVISHTTKVKLGIIIDKR